INRLELLKQNINLELLALGSEEERIMYERFTEALRKTYEHNSAILGMTVTASQSKARHLINASFQNATWSDRIWTNQQALKAELDKLLHRGIMQGRNPRELARELRKNIDSSISNSERLLRTETARIQQDVFVDSMEQAGID